MNNRLSIYKAVLFIIIPLHFFWGIPDCSSQTLNWNWAIGAGGNDYDTGSHDNDSNGNTYVSGGFRSDSIVFGNFTLKNDKTSYDDIFLVKYDQYGNSNWAKRIGGEGYDRGFITVGTNGYLYLSGTFTSDTIFFDNDTLINSQSGTNDIFISKLDTSGKVIWVKKMGGVKNESCNPVIFDSKGDFYFSGNYYSPSISFDSISLSNNSTNYNEAFIVKFSSEGSVIWANSSIGTGCVKSFTSSVCDKDLNVYAVGYFGTSTVSFGGISLYNNGGYDFYLTKYDPSGNIIWAKNFGEINYDFVADVAIDSDNNIYITGRYDSPNITFGNFSFANNGGNNITNDLYLTKLDSSGTVLWAKGVGGKNGEEGISILPGLNGSILLAGNFRSDTIWFDTFELINSSPIGQGFPEIFIAKYDSAGNVIWAESLAGDKSEGLSKISKSKDGSFFISGYFQTQSLKLGSFFLFNKGWSDFFLGKLDILTSAIETNEKVWISLFPNPAQENFTIRSDEPINNIMIVNSIGQQVLDRKINKSTDLNFNIAVPGIYFLLINTKNGIMARKVIINKG